MIILSNQFLHYDDLQNLCKVNRLCFILANKKNALYELNICEYNSLQMCYLLTNHYNIRKLNLKIDACDFFNKLPIKNLKIPCIKKIHVDFGDIDILLFQQIVEQSDKFKPFMKKNIVLEISYDVALDEEELYQFYNTFYDIIFMIKKLKISKINLSFNTNTMYSLFHINMYIVHLKIMRILGQKYNVEYWAHFSLPHRLMTDVEEDINKFKKKYADKFDTKIYDDDYELIQYFFIKF